MQMTQPLASDNGVCVINKDKPSAQLESIWQQLLEKLSKKLKKTSVNTWIKPCKPVSLDSESLVLATKNEFTRKFISQSFGQVIYECTKELLASPISVRIIVDASQEGLSSKEERADSSSETTSKPQAPAQQQTFAELSTREEMPLARLNRVANPFKVINSNLNSQLSFDNLVIGKSNINAYTFAKALTENDDAFYKSLYIYGDTGIGKSHFLHAIGNKLREEQASAVISYVRAQNFITDYINAIRKKNTDSFRAKFKDLSILLFDDIHQLDGKAATQQEFVSIFDEITARGGKLVFASKFSPNSFLKITPELQSRLSGSLIAENKVPAYEERLKIVELKARNSSLSIDEKYKEMLAIQCKASVRELEGAMLKLSAFQDFSNCDIDDRLVSDLFGTVHTDEDKKGLSIEKIVAAVAEHFDLSIEELRGKKRSQPFNQARHIAIFLIHQMLEISYQRIGEYFGGRKHSSIIHSIKTIKTQMESKLDDAKSLQNLLNQLRSTIKG